MFVKYARYAELNDFNFFHIPTLIPENYLDSTIRFPRIHQFIYYTLYYNVRVGTLNEYRREKN